MLILFLIVFVDLVGFGLLIPMLPFYVQKVGVGPEVITIVLGLYSLAQFIAAPIWGRLSDKYGRKPILVISSFSFAVSYVVLAYADTLALVIVSRILGGFMAGNIAAAQAYISDITTPENRAKGMGVLGAAFGLGFILGPAIGGLLGGNDPATADYFTPAMVSAAITFLAAVGAALFLPESLSAEVRARLAAQPKFTLKERLRKTFTRPTLIMLTTTGFLVVTAWAQFETVFALWADITLDYGPQQIGLLLTFIGVIGVIIQGGAIGKLTRIFGERKLVMAGVVFAIAGYLALAGAGDLTGTLIACALLAMSSGLFNPSMSSLVSKQAGETERGAIMGTYQGITSLSRVVGPAFSGVLFAQAGTTAPFFVAAAMAVPALALVILMPRKAA